MQQLRLPKFLVITHDALAKIIAHATVKAVIVSFVTQWRTTGCNSAPQIATLAVTWTHTEEPLLVKWLPPLWCDKCKSFNQLMQ